MLLILLAILLILLLAFYLSTQGTFTAVISFGSALLAAVLAAGVYEAFVPFMDGFHPEYARGIFFLGSFFFAFSFIKLASDFVVPKNIKLPLWVDRIAGGGVGLLAALVIIGTTVTGIEMLPLGESLLGAGQVTENGPTGRILPGRFATGLFYLANGRGLGGQPFASVHPDLSAELVGYRHTAEVGARQFNFPDLVDCRGFWILNANNAQSIPAEPGRVTVVVRTAITKGEDALHTSAEPTDSKIGDNTLLYLTPTQVRLVTGAPSGVYKQYYPVGHLVRGQTFKSLDLVKDYLVDDYSNGVAIHDWVFFIDEGQQPRLIEIKAGGRHAVGPEQKGFKAEVASAYPAHQYEGEQLKLVATVLGPGGTPVSNAEVWVLSSDVIKSQIESYVAETHDLLLQKAEYVAKSSNGYTSGTHKPGTIDSDMYASLVRQFRDTRNGPPDIRIPWSTMLRTALNAQAGPEGNANLNNLPKYIVGPFKELVRGSGSLLQEAKTDAQGKTPPMDIREGGMTIVAIVRTDKALRVWAMDQQIKRDKPESNQVTLSIGGGGNPELEIDLEK